MPHLIVLTPVLMMFRFMDINLGCFLSSSHREIGGHHLFTCLESGINTVVYTFIIVALHHEDYHLDSPRPFLAVFGA